MNFMSTPRGMYRPRGMYSLAEPGLLSSFCDFVPAACLSMSPPDERGKEVLIAEKVHH